MEKLARMAQLQASCVARTFAVRTRQPHRDDLKRSLIYGGILRGTMLEAVVVGDLDLLGLKASRMWQLSHDNSLVI